MSNICTPILVVLAFFGDIATFQNLVNYYESFLSLPPPLSSPLLLLLSSQII